MKLMMETSLKISHNGGPIEDRHNRLGVIAPLCIILAKLANYFCIGSF
jgi:hypothetical protein